MYRLPARWSNATRHCKESVYAAVCFPLLNGLTVWRVWWGPFCCSIDLITSFIDTALPQTFWANWKHVNFGRVLLVSINLSALHWRSCISLPPPAVPFFAKAHLVLWHPQAGTWLLRSETIGRPYWGGLNSSRNRNPTQAWMSVTHSPPDTRHCKNSDQV